MHYRLFVDIMNEQINDFLYSFCKVHTRTFVYIIVTVFVKCIPQAYRFLRVNNSKSEVYIPWVWTWQQFMVFQAPDALINIQSTEGLLVE